MVTPVWNRPGNSTTDNRPHCKSQASVGFPIAPRLRFRQNCIRKSSAADKAPGDWIPLPNPSARVRLVSDAVFSSDPRSDLCKIAENQALVDEPLELPAGPVGTAILVVDRPGHIVVESNCPTQQLLVVNESYYPGWTTTIDGHDAKPLRVNGDFLGVVTPPGRSRNLPGISTG